MTQSRAPNVFLVHIVPAANTTTDAVEKELARLVQTFAISAMPQLDPNMVAHRIMVDAQGQLLWEIAIDGYDLDDESSASPAIVDIVRREAESTLHPIATVDGLSAYCNILIPAPVIHLPIASEQRELLSFGTIGSETPWTDYAGDSKTPAAGQKLPAEYIDAITEVRNAIPSEPNLKPYKQGHVYWALEDKAHRAWLRDYFDKKLASATAADQRIIRAFMAFQTREGTTASINTYDSQIVTWGTGWGGLGWLGAVMNRLMTNDTVRRKFDEAGVRYRKSNTYDVVDLQSARVVTGKREALEVIRASLPLLNLLIQLARSPQTREAVADAQLGVFFISAGQITNASAMATQALFNMVSHLKHWAPGYATGCLEWALPQLPSAPASIERDKLLAPIVGRYFYGKARGHAWIPDWKQFQLYWQHMKEDGLDCLTDPFIQASSHPTSDPFAKPIAPQNPAPPKPVPPTTPSPKPVVKLQSALFAGRSELAAIAEGRANLKLGAEGSAVMLLQQALLQLGFSLPTGVTGEFDGAVERAIQAFQRLQDLKPDGIVGPLSLQKLDAQLPKS